MSGPYVFSDIMKRQVTSISRDKPQRQAHFIKTR